MNVTALTARQEMLLSFLREYQLANGYAPSFREMAEFLGAASMQGIHDHLKALEKKGAIRRTIGIPRAIRLLR